MSWHASPEVLDAFVAGRLDDGHRWSVERHLVTCDRCRGQVERAVDLPGELDRALGSVWDRVVFEIEADPRASVAERALRGIGLRDDVARLVAATPALTLSWIVAIVVTLVVTVLSAWATYSPTAAQDGSPLLFLVMAPLLPLAGVAVSFGPGVDPTYDIAVAAPMQAGRLLLLRTVAVLATTMPLALVAGLLLPVLSWTTAAWLLPALALAATTLALSTLVAPIVAGSALAAVWVGGVTLAESLSQAPLVAFGPTTQLLAAVVAAVAAGSLASRRYGLDHTPNRR